MGNKQNKFIFSTFVQENLSETEACPVAVPSSLIQKSGFYAQSTGTAEGLSVAKRVLCSVLNTNCRNKIREKHKNKLYSSLRRARVARNSLNDAQAFG